MMSPASPMNPANPASPLNPINMMDSTSTAATTGDVTGFLYLLGFFIVFSIIFLFLISRAY